VSLPQRRSFARRRAESCHSPAVDGMHPGMSIFADLVAIDAGLLLQVLVVFDPADIARVAMACRAGRDLARLLYKQTCCSLDLRPAGSAEPYAQVLARHLCAECLKPAVSPRSCSIGWLGSRPWRICEDCRKHVEARPRMCEDCGVLKPRRFALPPRRDPHSTAAEATRVPADCDSVLIGCFARYCCNCALQHNWLSSSYDKLGCDGCKTRRAAENMTKSKTDWMLSPLQCAIRHSRSRPAPLLPNIARRFGKDVWRGVVHDLAD